MPWLVVIIFIVLGALAYYFWRSQNRLRTPSEGEPMPQTFDFDEQEGRVRRKLRVIAAEQTVAGKRQKVRIELRALPDVTNLKPPPEKQIDALLSVVINPVVYASETGESLTTFNPPLTVTVHYKKQDAEMTTESKDGTPQLSLVSAYESDDGWRFEKLPTTVTPNSGGNGGTLTAQLSTLEPGDPLWVGKP